MLFMLLGVTALAQKPKYIIVKTYKNGQVIGQKRLPIQECPPYVRTVHVPKGVKKTITVEVPVEKIVEVIKYDTVKIPVEKIVEKQVIKNIPYEVTVEKIVTKEVPAPLTNAWYFGPSSMATLQNPNGGLGLNVATMGVNLLFKNKYSEIFQAGAGVMLRTKSQGPTPYINLGWYIKIK